MKRLLCTSFSVISFIIVHSQNVGVGTTNPIARLHVADSNVLFSGPLATPQSMTVNPPATGPGVRLMWYPGKAAFRVGEVNASEWDKDSIGNYSFAAGQDAKARGAASFASGHGTSAHGPFSFASGEYTNATGFIATAMGAQTRATYDMSTAMGFGTWARGPYTTAMGWNAVALGTAATAMGYDTRARSAYSLVIGRHNDTTSTSRLFEIGNGTSNGARSNAMTVHTNGNVGFGAINPSGYGHGGSNKIVEINNNLTGANVQSHLVLSTAGSSGSLGGLTWAAPSLGGESRGGYIGCLFETANSSRLVFYNNNGSTFGERFIIQANGSAWLQGSLAQSSDARLKTGIEPLQHSLSQILQLKGYHYYWKRDASTNRELQYGVLAQEVQKIFPALVHSNEAGELSVNYIGLVPVLIEAVREQQKQIDELRSLVKSLVK